ncbi:MAG: HEPN domain-containing protein [Chloroflexi bacterium]|nr:HEPN domain-containing protein [Chloroflexota bacterium]
MNGSPKSKAIIIPPDVKLRCGVSRTTTACVFTRTNPPRSHNLIELLRLCSARDGSFELIHPFLDALMTYAIDIRYPGEFSSKDEAHDAVNAMKQVREFVRGKLPRSK